MEIRLMQKFGIVHKIFANKASFPLECNEHAVAFDGARPLFESTATQESSGDNNTEPLC